LLKKSSYKHPKLCALIVAVMLTLSSGFILLDAFAFAKSEGPLLPAATLTFTPVPTQPSRTPVQKVYTDTQYTDDNIQIDVQKVVKPGLVYYVADIRLSSLQYFKTAFANNTPGRNQHEAVSDQAKDHNAILAISGDYYGYRNTGVTIRNGTLYRDNPDGESMVLMQNGEMKIVDKSVSGKSLVEQGALHSWSFGPALVIDGQYVQRSSPVSALNPRTGLGMIEPYHYIFIVVDGRVDDSKGVVMKDFAQLFLEYGCKVAYNLDGGGSATMVMHNKLVNRPSQGDERKISDSIYIGLE